LIQKYSFLISYVDTQTGERGAKSVSDVNVNSARLTFLKKEKTKIIVDVKEQL
jgi:hypothetical protein